MNAAFNRCQVRFDAMEHPDYWSEFEGESVVDELDYKLSELKSVLRTLFAEGYITRRGDGCYELEVLMQAEEYENIIRLLK